MTTINSQRRQPSLPRGHVFLATVSHGTPRSKKASGGNLLWDISPLLPLSSPKKIPPKKTGIWAELERHLTVFITCQRHIGVLHTKEQVRVQTTFVISPQAYGFLGFLCTASERLIFYFLVRSFVVFRIPTPNQGNRKLGHTFTPSHISSLRLSPGWKFGLHFRARQELSQYRVAFAIVFFGLVVLFSSFFFYCHSPMRLTIRGTCSNALQPGKKGPGQKLWIPNSSSLFGFSRRH